MQEHLITREIGIDAAHRVPFHGSKCKNLHGHRYTVFATCAGPLEVEGEEAGMVLDFGFLKDEMTQIIDAFCDHGTVLWCGDEFLPLFLDEHQMPASVAKRRALSAGWLRVDAPASRVGKLYVVPFVPTAEHLARHWFERLLPRVVHRSGGRARLVSVLVYETPNCSAQYPSMTTTQPLPRAVS